MEMAAKKAAEFRKTADKLKKDADDLIPE